MKQNDCAGNHRAFDSLNNFRGIINLGVVGPSTPSDQPETAGCQNRMQERVLHAGRRTKPEWRGNAERSYCSFECVNFLRESLWAESPETELRVGLSVVADGVTGIQ